MKKKANRSAALPLASSHGNAELQLGKLKNAKQELDVPKKAKLELGAPLEEPQGWYSRGYLPHRDEAHLKQFITFRLADSLPQEKLRFLEEKLLSMPEDCRDQEKRKQIEDWLDSGMGCCLLQDPPMAQVMENALKKFDGERYRLIAWCIMPNHVHVLIEPLFPLSKIIQSWKSFTGKWANSYYNRNAELQLGNVRTAKQPLGKVKKAKQELGVPSGAPGEAPDGVPNGAPNPFWMREYWDRYIRDENHLQKTIAYIHENPVKAGLCASQEKWRWSSAYGIAELPLGSSSGNAELQLGLSPGNAELQLGLSPGNAELQLGKVKKAKQEFGVPKNAKLELGVPNGALCGVPGDVSSSVYQLGNTDLLKLPKTAFLCSRQVPATVVLKCYDWAIEQREKGHCVISGFHSQIEKDVLHYLLKGKQPIIVVLARGLKEKLEPEFVKPLEQDRLLIITPFDKSVKRVSRRNAQTRNQLMATLADQITIGYASPGGQLEELLKGIEKPINKIV